MLSDFWGHGVPDGSEIEYAEHYLFTSPRMALSDARRFGEIGYDYMLLDEAEINRNAYYSEFLPKGDMRYFLAGSLTRGDAENAALAVQRSSRQGHVNEGEIRLMRSSAAAFPAGIWGHPAAKRRGTVTAHARGRLRLALRRRVACWRGRAGAFRQCRRPGLRAARDGIRFVRGRLEFPVSSAAELRKGARGSPAAEAGSWSLQPPGQFPFPARRAPPTMSSQSGRCNFRRATSPCGRACARLHPPRFHDRMAACLRALSSALPRQRPTSRRHSSKIFRSGSMRRRSGSA